MEAQLNQLFSLRFMDNVKETVLDDNKEIDICFWTRTDHVSHYAYYFTKKYEMSAAWSKETDAYHSYIRKLKSKWTKKELDYLQRKGYQIDGNLAEHEM